VYRPNLPHTFWGKKKLKIVAGVQPLPTAIPAHCSSYGGYNTVLKQSNFWTKSVV